MTTPTPSKTTFSAAELRERTVQRRAVEAVIWGMPAVNYDLMYQAMVREAKGAFNQIVYWSRLSDWRNQTLTPNPDAVYFMPFVNTKDVGPMVLEIPPADEGGSITGSVDDSWQTAIEDVGPAGVDKGKGGKYVILPPGYTGKLADGYIAMPSSTYRTYALLRSNPASGSDADVAKAVAYARRIKLYPYSAAASPPATRFVDAFGIVFDATIPYDARFFEALHRAVQDEVWLERDRAMIDPLRSLGIEKGKPFQPDTGTSELLRAAAVEARAWLEARYEAAYTPAFAEGARWALPVDHALQEALQTNFGNPETYPVEARGVTYAFAFFSAKHLGAGQFYLFTINDRDGRTLDGGNAYRLTVPPNAPVRLYWSATAYDRATHALIREQKWASRASTTQGLQKNADGSVDVFFGPTAPAGNQSNWVPTRAGSSFEVLFRLYGPEKPLFDKTWRLPDIERVAS